MLTTKIAVVSSECDNTITACSKFHEILLFRSFNELEKYVNTTPDIFESIVIPESELQFTASNVALLQTVIKSEFLQLQDSVLYLVDKNLENIKEIKKYFAENSEMHTVVYTGVINQTFIADIITGIARRMDESDIRVKTYRVRADEYSRLQNIRRYEDNNNEFITDEEDLKDIPEEEEPIYGFYAEDRHINNFYISGERTIERTSMSYLIAQYLSYFGRTIIIEGDPEYHTLTDIATKTDVAQSIYYIEDFYDNAKDFVTKLESSPNNLIVLGVRSRIKFNASFIADMIIHNCDVEFIRAIVTEVDYIDIPFNAYETIVIPNRSSDIIRFVDRVSSIADIDKVNFVGVELTDLGGVNLDYNEMKSVLTTLLSQPIYNFNLVKLGGLNLKEEGYDIFGLIARGN